MLTLNKRYYKNSCAYKIVEMII